MARELPIQNGRLTTDLDADGHKIKNLSGGTEAVSWDNVTGKPSFATVATSGSYNDLTNKPTIPDVSGKMDGEAAYPAWDPQQSPYELGYIVSHKGRIWRVADEDVLTEPVDGNSDWVEVDIKELKQDKLSAAQISNIGAVPGKADKAVPSAAGNLAALNAQGNLMDSGAKPSDFAAKDDLPYRLVEPGKWEFSGSGVQDGVEYWIEIVDGGVDAEYNLYAGAMLASETRSGINETVINFAFVNITATRASLPGHLLDRANNLIDATSGNVTLTLPEYQAGKLRDLLVYVDLGDDGTDPYSITFNFPSGESNTGFKAEGDDPTSATFPAPTAAGEWWYSFTECKPHKFSVSLKQLQDAPQAQGGA